MLRCRRLSLRLGDESGMALVMAIGVMMVVAIMGSSMVLYATSNESASQRSSKRQSARSLAESGLESAIAVLANPANTCCPPEPGASAGVAAGLTSAHGRRG